MSVLLMGIGVARGIAIGKVHLLLRDVPEVMEYNLPKDLLEQEVERFEVALEQARVHLRTIRDHLPISTPADVTAFIDIHLLMLEDSTLSKVPVDLIRDQQCNAEWALKQQRDSLVQIFESMEDPYLRTRKDDVDQVVNLVQGLLTGKSSLWEAGAGRLRGKVVVVDELSPADVVLFYHEGGAAFITERGGPTSHTAILARSLDLPAVVGVRRARQFILEGETVILDGRRGIVVVNPDLRSLQHYQQRHQEDLLRVADLLRLRTHPACTQDGRRVRLMANVELPEDIDELMEVGAEGVGLYRTEFLYMNRSEPPSEDEQFAVYRGLVQVMDGHPVTIRTLDLGADKPFAGSELGGLATNPALGLRGIRLCLRVPSLFIPQLRAILRVSAYGPVRMAIPMVTQNAEVLQVIHLLEQIRRDLRREGLAFNENMPLGGIVEVPAAALTVPSLARHLDFLSLGTNDLIQYTLAIDRIDDQVSYLYDPLHPAVLRLIYTTLRAGARAGIPVGMCGEMAGDPRYTRLLVGLGLQELSMHPSSLPEVKQVINTSDYHHLAKLARRTVYAHDTEAVAALMELINEGL
ncbi:Phosphoenolpyruvate-protein phosphotransferase [Gammaproteobacteria bacterium]